MIQIELQYFGRFETEHTAILRYEDFIDKSFRVLLRDDKTLHFLGSLLKIGQATVTSNKVKGENFSWSIGKLEGFLDKFLEKGLVNVRMRGKLFEMKQRIRDLRVENKSTHLTALNNSMEIQNYAEEIKEIRKNQGLGEENEENLMENNEEIVEREKEIEIREEKWEIKHNIMRNNNEKAKIVEEIVNFPVFHIAKPEELQENLEEILPEFKKIAHHGLDFIDKNDRFASDKNYQFPDISDMPKVNMEDED